MSYVRVIPRDLFNESALLKCYGRLWILLDEDRRHKAALMHVNDSGPFRIEQDESDGSISVQNLIFTVNHKTWKLFRSLNSRNSWCFWAIHEDEEIKVFTHDGFFTPQFKDLIRGVKS